jgi:hypothetical protein
MIKQDIYVTSFFKGSGVKFAGHCDRVAVRLGLRFLSL